MTGATQTESPRSSTERGGEARLLFQFLRWSEVFALTLAALFVAMYAVFRSPMSFFLAIFLGLVVWPTIRYARRLTERGRVLRALGIGSVILWLLPLATSARGGLGMAAGLPLVVLPVVLAIPFTTRRQLLAYVGGSFAVSIVCAIFSVYGPLIPSTMPNETLAILVAGIVPVTAGVSLLAVWYLGSRLREALSEMQTANRALAESEHELEQKVEDRTADLARKVAEIADINELARTVNSTLDLDRVIATVMTSLQKLFHFEQMGFGLLDETRENLQLDLRSAGQIAAELVGESQLSIIPMSEQTSVFVNAVRNCRTVYLPDVRPELADQMSPSDRRLYELNQLKSIVIFPMELQGEVIGGIGFTTVAENLNLGEDDLASIRRYLTPLVTAIQNGRLFKQAQQSAAEIEDINELARTVNSTLDMDRVMQTVFDGLQRVFHFDQMSLAMHERDSDVLVVERPMGSGFTPDLIAKLKDLPIPLSETNSAFVHVVKNDRPFLLPSITPQIVSLMSPTDRLVYDLNPPKAILICPLELEGRVIGLLYFGNTEQEVRLRSGEIETIQRYLTPLATAIQNARLFKQAEQAAAEVSDINEVGRVVSSTLDLDRVIEIMKTGLQKLFPFDQMGVFLLDEGGERLRLDRQAGDPFETRLSNRLRNTGIPLSETESAVATAVLEKRYVYVPTLDPANVDSFSPTDRAIYESNPLQSLLLCPLEIQGEAVGTIFFGSTREAFELSPADIETIQRYVTTLGTAIQNARLFEEAKTARAGAEAANEAKSAFLANMSHELRTPLNAIIGYSEMLQEEAEDAGQEELVPDLKKIHGAGRHLLELINGVLDLAKIESGKMDVYLEEFDVTELLQGVEATVQPLMRENGNTLATNSRSGLGRMHSDVTKLRQSLFNLLSNASKFTKQGTIELTAERTTQDDRDWLRFRVTDSGIGMNEEQLGQVFEEFTQAESSTTREYGGTGLGLPITKKFCEMLGGSVTATSEPGRGSCFEIRLPARAPTALDMEAAPSADAKRAAVARAGAATVLVIDDDAAARDLIGRFLGGEGFGVVMAADGTEGLRLARERRPDVITLDVVMPHVDGWSVLSELKADPELADIPVILLTMTDDRSLGDALGAAEFLTKPIDWDQFGRVLHRYESTGGDAAAPALVVDDDPLARDVLRRGLERAGWPVVEAENGRVALARVAENPPRLILLDLMMPEMDGFEFVAELRRHEEWRSIPVLVITAKEVDKEDRARLEGNVARILQKGSYDREDLLNEVRRLVETRSPARDDSTNFKNGEGI